MYLKIDFVMKKSMGYWTVTWFEDDIRQIINETDILKFEIQYFYEPMQFVARDTRVALLATQPCPGVFVGFINAVPSMETSTYRRTECP